MAQDRNYRVFPNKLEMLKFFGSYVPDLDVKTSARLAPFMYVYKGKIMVERNFILFIRAMEELSGLGIDESVSAMRRGTYIVFFDKPLPAPNRRGATVTAQVKNDDKDLEVETEEKTDEVADGKVEVTEPTEEVVETPEEGLAPTTPSEQEASDVIQAAAALENDSDKKGSKDKLADFAASKGVTLNKTKTFENMLADFKTALGQ